MELWMVLSLSLMKAALPSPCLLMGFPLSFDLKNGSTARVCILQMGPFFNASRPQQWVLAWECHPTPTSLAPTSMPMTVAPLCLANLRGPSPLRGITRG